MSADAFGSLMAGVVGLFIISMFILSLTSLSWVYRDAQRRGKTGCLWLLIAFFTWPLGVVAYYLLREERVQL
jgi:hypothetical protein